MKVARTFVWYAFILANDFLASAAPEVWDAEWKPVVMPLSGKVRLILSREYIKVDTRVMSAVKASACRSCISFECSCHDCGMPAGAPAPGRSAVAFATA